MTTRACAECAECCFSLGVHEINKGDFSNCWHTRPTKKGSCSLYETRPKSCAEFTCLWLYGELEERDRPDQLGIIFATADMIPGQPVVMAYVRKMGADKSGRGQELIIMIAQQYPVCIIRSDQSKSMAVPENLRHVIPILNREMYAKAEVVDGELRRLPVVQG